MGDYSLKGAPTADVDVSAHADIESLTSNCGIFACSGTVNIFTAGPRLAIRAVIIRPHRHGGLGQHGYWVLR